jgi:tetratricopeptide (TPR) repeat protein
MFDGIVAWLGEYGDKVQGAEALLAIMVLIGGAAFFPVKHYFKRREAPAEVKIANPEALIAATSPPKGIQMDVESFVAFQKQMRDEALKSVSEVHGEEKKRLEEKIDALNARLADPDRALAEQQAIITSLEEKLSRQGNQLGGDAIIEAKAALEAGDFTKARNLFEAVAAQTAPDVKTHADAAFALGQIAETEIRWHDAAAHFVTAARLNPTFDTLQKARTYTWRAGNYSAAFRFGEDLLVWSKAQGTQRQLATALNEHAITLKAQGQYGKAEEMFIEVLAIDAKTIGIAHSDYATHLNNLAAVVEDQGRNAEAEGIYRQALAIDAATIGSSHPEYAIDLNNLAGVVWAQGRYSEAEDLYRQALGISAATIGTAHPSYAIRLNNLASVVRAQGRLAEAERLFRQAIEIGEATIGVAHPAYAIYLNNLAQVTKDQGRYAEAEELYRHALSIDEVAIGAAHPEYATDLNNLAGVVQAQGRYGEAYALYWQALETYRDTLAAGHPNIRTVAQNLLSLLQTHFPDDPEIPALQALLTPAP